MTASPAAQGARSSRSGAIAAVGGGSVRVASVPLQHSTRRPSPRRRGGEPRASRPEIRPPIQSPIPQPASKNGCHTSSSRIRTAPPTNNAIGRGPRLLVVSRKIKMVGPPPRCPRPPTSAPGGRCISRLSSYTGGIQRRNQYTAETIDASPTEERNLRPSPGGWCGSF